MAKIPVRFSESAVGDLEALRRWYDEQGRSDLGRTLVGEIVVAIEALQDHPDIGRVVPEFEQPFLRELIRPPFRIVCRRNPTSFQIVRVWRGERKLHLPTDQL